MTLVQVAHRRHEADRPTLASGLRNGGAELGLGLQSGGGHGWTRAIDEEVRVHRSMPWGSRPFAEIIGARTPDLGKATRKGFLSADPPAPPPAQGVKDHQLRGRTTNDPRYRTQLCKRQPMKQASPWSGDTRLGFLKKAGLAGGGLIGGGALLSALTPAAAMAAGKGRPPGELRQGRHRHPQLRPHPRVPRGRLLQRGDREQKKKTFVKDKQAQVFLQRVTADENAHVAFLEKALGSKATQARNSTSAPRPRPSPRSSNRVCAREHRRRRLLGPGA